jgi:signal transduction histidine kinase
VVVDRPSVPGLDEPARMLATPVDGRVLVVGATRENRAEALRNLREELLIAGPIALLLATALGYLLAGSGLRAVEHMRMRAEQISADWPAERLPVPRTGDELQRLGETLNAMLGRLQSAVAREREFVADASHELRTPLALMRAELDYAVHYARNEQELRAAIRTASEETDRLVALSGALLLIASSDRGGLPLRRDRLRVSELLDAIASRFSWRAQELDRHLVVSESANGITIHGDRLRLEQALGNLVDNALRHGADDVRLAARKDGDAIVFDVSDDGRGFADDVLPQAFERFTRGTSGGSGLGLSIVRAIAEAHGGTVVAENAAHRGARVSLRIPTR